jgi:integrase/recombinase XerC
MRPQCYRMVNNIIEDYLDHLRMAGRSQRTIDDRREILARIDADLPYGLAQATTEELQGWLYRDEWSASTRETYYGAVRSFFVWATGPWDQRLDFDPSELLPRPRTPRGLPRPITDEQLTRILTEAAEPYRTWTILAAYAGLRCCEISGLDRGHVTDRAITVLSGKGGKPAILPTHPVIWAAMVVLPDGPVALTTDGIRADPKYVSIRAAVYFRRKLGMPGVALHRARHWYGTNLYRATKDIRRTQELMRHASPATTAIYTLVSDEERWTAIQTLPTITAAQSS